MLLVRGQLLGSLNEDLAPIGLFVGRHIIPQELVDGVVSLRSFEIGLEGRLASY